MLSVIYAECHLCWVSFILKFIYTEGHLSWVLFLLSVKNKPFMLSVDMLSVAILSVVMPNVVAPKMATWALKVVRLTLIETFSFISI
jgi:hypothetical protein